MQAKMNSLKFNGREIQLICLLGFAMGILTWIQGQAAATRFGYGVIVTGVLILISMPIIYQEHYRNFTGKSTTTIKTLFIFCIVFIIDSLFVKFTSVLTDGNMEWQTIGLRASIFIMFSFLVWLVYKRIRKASA